MHRTGSWIICIERFVQSAFIGVNSLFQPLRQTVGRGCLNGVSSLAFLPEHPPGVSRAPFTQSGGVA